MDVVHEFYPKHLVDRGMGVAPPGAHQDVGSGANLIKPKGLELSGGIVSGSSFQPPGRRRREVKVKGRDAAGTSGAEDRRRAQGCARREKSC